MECIELSAKDRTVHGRVCLFLDGQDVTEQAYWARVPPLPSIPGNGEVKGFVEPLTKLADGTLAEWHKTGVVSWAWRAA